MADFSLDARRIAKDQANRMVDTTDLLMTVSHPFTTFNSELLRTMSTLYQLAATYQEKNVELLTNLAEHNKRNLEEQARQFATETQRTA
jgi:prephenate dehydrogenase